MKSIRDRIVEFRRVPAAQIVKNPKNPNVHGDEQRLVLRGILNEIGFAGAELCYHSARHGGALVLIDGEARLDEMKGHEIPCLITDLDDTEADKLLLLFDPVRSLQTQDDARINALLEEVRSDDDAVLDLMDRLEAEHKIDLADTELKKLDVMPPPRMSWVLIGIETVRFGEIAEALESIGLVDGIVIENTVNDVEPTNAKDDANNRSQERQSQSQSETGPAETPAPPIPRKRKRAAAS